MSQHLKFVKVKEAYEAFISDCSKVRSGALIYEAIEEVLKNPTTETVFVVDANGKLIGMIPLRDLIRVSAARFQVRGKGFGDFLRYLRDLMKDDVDDIMRPPLSVTLEDTLLKAMRAMEAYDLNSLPVVDKNGILKGELNGAEILKYALEGVKRTDEEAKKLRQEREFQKKKGDEKDKEEQ